jgi:hypothetical protein
VCNFSEEDLCRGWFLARPDFTVKVEPWRGWEHSNCSSHGVFWPQFVGRACPHCIREEMEKLKIFSPLAYVAKYGGYKRGETVAVKFNTAGSIDEISKGWYWLYGV